MNPKRLIEKAAAGVDPRHLVESEVQGGLSDEVWKQQAIQDYYEPFGYVGQPEHRSKTMDVAVENALRDRGLNDAEIAAWMISKLGRWLIDELSSVPGGAKRADADTLAMWLQKSKTLKTAKRDAERAIRKFGE
jgi:hypothetical protein